jgi:Helix-turn-helix domain
MLQVHRRTVRRWALDGLLEEVRIGGKLVRYTPESVEALMSPAKKEGSGHQPNPSETRGKAPRHVPTYSIT